MWLIDEVETGRICGIKSFRKRSLIIPQLRLSFTSTLSHLITSPLPLKLVYFVGPNLPGLSQLIDLFYLDL